MDQAKLERMLKILMFLSSGIKYSVDQIAERFEISTRTAHRYIETFRKAGFIIPKPVEGRYYVDKKSPYFKEISELLHFTEEEAFILGKAIHSIDEVNIIKTNLIKKLYALYDFDRVAVTVVKKENSENVHNLIKAIKEKKQVILRAYQSAHSSLIRDRLVEPFGFTTNYISVWAFDPESQTNKLFKTARIKKVDITDNNRQNEQKHKEGNIDIFRISSYEKTPVKLQLNLRAYNLLLEEYPLSEKYITKINDTKYLYDGWVCSFDGIGRFVLGLCEDIEILKPPALKKFLKEKIKCFKN